MAKPLVPLTQSNKYADFMHERDKALEGLLNKYLNHLGPIVSILKKKALDCAVLSRGSDHYDLKRRVSEFERKLKPWFEMGMDEATALITRLRRTTYALSYVGHAEAIARAKADSVPYKASLRNHPDDVIHGGKYSHRVHLTFARLFHKVIEAFQLSLVLSADETPEDMKSRIASAFPKRSEGSKRKILAKMKESDKPGLNDAFLSTGVIEPDEWDQILEDYFTEEFPPNSPNRTVYSRVFFTDAPDDEGRYEWELERDVTEDFVQQVREGENDAAKDQGVTDFEWISIIDSKTDPCCEWRDGLSSKEIEDALDNDHSDDECDATSPPAHFNCRCRLAPMTEELNETTKSNLMDFESFLASKE